MKIIKLDEATVGDVYVNVDKIEVIYKEKSNLMTSNTVLHTVGGLIWNVTESVDQVMKLIYSEPVQDGIKTVYKDNAIVKKKIDDLTDVNNLNNLNLRSK